jgi:hypothetical protein
MGRAAHFTKGDAMETPTPCADVLTRLQWIRANLQGKRETAVRILAPERAVKDEK